MPGASGFDNCSREASPNPALHRSERRPIGWRMPPILNWRRCSLSEPAALQSGQMRHLLYSSERLKSRAFAAPEWLRPRRRATHIQACPGQPREVHQLMPKGRIGITRCKYRGSGSSNRFCPPIQGEVELRNCARTVSYGRMEALVRSFRLMRMLLQSLERAL